MYRMYHEMSRHITVASAVLNHAEGAAQEIDRVLSGGQSRPELSQSIAELFSSHVVPFSTCLSRNCRGCRATYDLGRGPRNTSNHLVDSQRPETRIRYGLSYCEEASRVRQTRHYCGWM